ncbi:hypothetical protein OG361_30620 [Streptomyces sp. NBC_00090]|uniref:hypothetical protein n=1 Tax=Streptomyces sp. NBC_00090 TaxID=2903619 RepID=UPI0032476EE8
MSLEWDGFRLSLGSDGLLEFTWIGGGIFETRVTNCLSASLRHPKEAGGSHRLVFRFRFPGIATGSESVVIRADVPVGKVDQAQRLVGVLWRDYGVPDEADAKADAETVTVSGTARAPVTVTATDGHTGTGHGLDTDTRTGIDAGPGAGAVPEAASDEAELERTPDAPGWIVSPAGPGSRELFRAVMERPANSDH